MTTEQLLAPRYKVIADYPGNNVEVGRVFLSDIGEYFDKFKGNFKRLEWWEDREEKDAPEYVKLNPENTRGQKNIFKVTKAVSYPEGDFEIYIDDAEFPGAHAKYFLPATEQDYIDYHKSLKL